MARVYSGLDVRSDFGGRFPWKSDSFEVQRGVRLAYVDEGPKDARLTFLCLHGNPTWGFLYRRFIERLSTEHRVVVPDHVGFGRSDKPREPAYYTLERHIRNLEALVDELSLRNVIPVMQDWGGPIGMGFATRHPDRVAGVVVLNTWSFVSDNGGVNLPWLFRWLVLGKGGWKRSVDANIFVERFLAKGGARRMDGAVLDAYRAPHPTPEDRVGTGRFPQLIPPVGDIDHEAYGTMREIENGLAKLDEKPALIVWAKRDIAFRKAQLERWTQVFRTVDGPHLLPDAKHYLQEDAPDAILDRIEPWARWLTSTPARRARGAAGA